MIDFLLRIFEEHKSSDALVWHGTVFSYKTLLERINNWREIISSENITTGSVVILEADFSPNSVALFLALTEAGCIIVPLTSSVESKKAEFIKIAQGEVSITIDGQDTVTFNRLATSADHPVYARLMRSKRPGLVLFSSGSTGESKAGVHDLANILNKFRIRRHSLRTITFLLYDHIGGVNTMLYQLSNAGCIVTVESRDPDTVLGAVERYSVELLPTSPTFVNLILLSEAYRRHDLSSLATVSYGTEPMPESTLKRFHQLMPHIRLLQTYGLSEVGILRSKSKRSDSLWVKVGGEGFETRVTDGILQIKADSAILGYLNAPSPFTDDGWFDTGDVVEVDGEYIKILGRMLEIINVGGEKVYPTEVETVIQEMDNVAEATVYGEKNAIVGNIVCARIRLIDYEKPGAFTQRLKKFCSARMPAYMVPVRIITNRDRQYGGRFKKIRSELTGTTG